MNAAEWFSRQSFHDHSQQPIAPIESNTWDATWCSWDAQTNAWRYYARQGLVILETDDVGVAL